MLHSLATLAGLMLSMQLSLHCPSAEVPLHDFEDPSIWKLNPDGGGGVEISRDTRIAREGAALRIRYRDAPPHWGNLLAPCRVPGEARALRFALWKHSADPAAALHVWLLEPDGDSWVQRVPAGKEGLASLPGGWHEIRMPVAAFVFERRGPGTRDMTAADRMLIGSNFGDLEVTVDSMGWELDPASKKVPLPRTADLRVERGKRGSVGILQMGDGLPAGFRTAHPPAGMAAALRERGFGVTLLEAGDLADGSILTRESFDCLVLPLGPCFPLDARDAFLSYLKAGGSFLSTDGYAFDSLLELTGHGWQPPGTERTAGEMGNPIAPHPPPLNTRTGTPGDAMTFSPDQIGVFDPSFTLLEAALLLPASFWAEDPRWQALRYSSEEPLTGFSACGLTGRNNPVLPPVYRRWIPVLNAFDSTGKILRGTALALMVNHSGPFLGSSWAFSGITSGADLFLGSPERRELLADIVDRLTRRVFLHDLASDLASYRRGETAHLRVRASNHGREALPVTVKLSILGREIATASLSLSPGKTEEIQGHAPVDGLLKDHAPFSAALLKGGKIIDRMDSALCVWDERVVAGGPHLAWKDNYMEVDGRAAFLVGTNQTGMMFYSAGESPAVWDRDFRTMAEHNIHLLRILHFSPFSEGGYDGRPTLDPLGLRHRPEKLCRQMDAIVQLAQKHRVSIFLSLHDWMGVGLTDEQLAAQADWNRFWVERYRGVPGIIYDVQNEPSVDVPGRPDILALWNRWLKERYGTDEALRAAWSRSPPQAPLPDVPLEPGTNEWEDVRSADRKRFETEILNRWVKANVDGIKAGDSNALACVGYLPNMPPADKILGVRYTDFSNMHYYGSVEGFPLELKLIDRRFVGKGLSIGECGAIEAHDFRVHGNRGEPVAESIRRFQHYFHYAVGVGAAFLANWDWKDFDEMVFPWGLMRSSSFIPKPWLHTLTQESLLLSMVEPRYESPQVFVLIPDRHRVGPRFDELHGALHRSIDLLLDQRVNFGMANEEDLDRLPPSAKALLWPIPYCPDDATFERVLSWTRAGGAFYLSGDVSFDAARRPTRGDRLRLLGLTARTPAPPFAVPEAAWQEAPVETTLGKGRVTFVPYPLELRRRERDREIYGRFLTVAGVPRIRVEPENVRALSIPTRDGGRITMLARTTGGTDLLPVTLPEGAVTVELTGGGLAFVLLNGKGHAIAAESQGAISVAGKRLARASGHFALCALDGLDLRVSEQVLVLPHQEGRVEVAGLAALEKSRCHVGPPAGPGEETAPATDAIAFPAGSPGYVAVVAPAGQMQAALAALRARMELR